MRTTITFFFLFFYFIGHTQITTDTAKAYQYFREAKVLYATSKTDSALLYFENCLEILSHIKTARDSSKWEYYHQKIGKFYDDNANLALASQYYERGCKLAEAWYVNHKYFGVIGLYNYDLGVCYSHLGFSELAINCFIKAKTILTKKYSSRHKYVAACYSALGTNYGDINDYDNAFKYMAKALEIYPPNTIGAGIVYNNRGILYKRLDRYEESKKDFDQAISIYKILIREGSEIVIVDAKRRIVSSYDNLAGLMLVLKQNDNAKRILNLQKNVLPSKGLQTIAYHNTLAGYFQQTNQLDSALYYSQKNVDFLTQKYGEKHYLISEAHTYLAKTYLKQKDHQNAVKSAHDALLTSMPGIADTENEYQNPDFGYYFNSDAIKALTLKAITLESLYKVSQDISDLKFAFETIELTNDLIIKMRKDITQHHSQIAISRQATEPYHVAVRICYALYEETQQEYYKHKLFYYSNKVKSEALANVMKKIELTSISDISEEALEIERNFKISIIRFEAELYREYARKELTNYKRINELDYQLEAAQYSYDSLLNVYAKKYPTYYELKHITKSLRISDLQNKLGETDAFIDYTYDDELLFINIIKKYDFKSFSFSFDKDFDFETTILSLHSIISGHDMERKSTQIEFSEKSHLLYEYLIGNIKEELTDIEKLVIVGEGTLHYLPFEVLLTNHERTKAFNKMPFLIKDFEIAYHYSAPLYMKGANNSKYKSSDKVLSIAPVFDQSSKSPLSMRADSLEPLMWSEYEVKNVAKSFARYTTLLRSRATLTAFLREIEYNNFDFIHISTHGKADIENADSSWLAFHSNTKDSVYLFAKDVYNLNLNTKLVVLSSCESGVGRVASGEGMISLTRGFLFAGSDNVLFSLWKVDDEYTFKLMKGFYENLKKGVTYSAALRQSKLELINETDDIFAALPNYWGSFVLIGQ